MKCFFYVNQLVLVRKRHYLLGKSRRVFQEVITKKIRLPPGYGMSHERVSQHQLLKLPKLLKITKSSNLNRPMRESLITRNKFYLSVTFFLYWKIKTGNNIYLLNTLEITQEIVEQFGGTHYIVGIIQTFCFHQVHCFNALKVWQKLITQLNVSINCLVILK